MRFPLSCVLTLLLLSACGPGAPGEQAGRTCLPGPEFVAREEGPIRLGASGDAVEARAWNPGSEAFSCRGVLFVTGVDGGFIEPVDGIYERLARKLLDHGIASVFVKYRMPGVLEPSVADAMAGIERLRSLGASRIAIAAWSFGGAVMVNAAVRAPEVRTLVGFAPQSRYTEAVARFQGSILLFHSELDENVPSWASRQILDTASDAARTRFELYPSGDHHLTGMGATVDPVAEAWLLSEL